MRVSTSKLVALGLLGGSIGMAAPSIASAGTVSLGCMFNTTGSTMTLVADCVTYETIEIPSGKTLNGAGHTITAGGNPAAAAPGTGQLPVIPFAGSIIHAGGPKASVVNTNIDASWLGEFCPTEGLFAAILFDSTKGAIKNNNILGPTCINGAGIAVRSDPLTGRHPKSWRVDVENNWIAGAGYAAIVGEGDVALDAEKNIVELSGIGFGASAAARRSNAPTTSSAPETPETPGIGLGIVFQFGARGQAQKNQVLGSFEGGVVGLAGIVVADTDKVRVTKNTIGGALIGVGVLADCSTGVNPYDIKIDANNVVETFVGVIGGAVVLDDTTCSPQIRSMTVRGNQIQGLLAGVLLLVGDPVDALTPKITGTEITKNKISFAGTCFETGMAVNNKVERNTCEPLVASSASRAAASAMGMPELPTLRHI